MELSRWNCGTLAEDLTFTLAEPKKKKRKRGPNVVKGIKTETFRLWQKTNLKTLEVDTTQNKPKEIH